MDEEEEKQTSIIGTAFDLGDSMRGKSDIKCGSTDGCHSILFSCYSLCPDVERFLFIRRHLDRVRNWQCY